MPSSSKRKPLKLKERKKAAVEAHIRNPRTSQARIAKQAGLCRRSVARALECWQRYGSVDDPNTTRGPEVGSHNKVASVALDRAVDSMRGRNGLSLKAAATTINTTVKTLRAAAHAAGVVCAAGKRRPLLTGTQMRKRLAFARRHRRAYAGVAWRNGLYTDSKVFYQHPRLGDKPAPYWDAIGEHTPVEYSRGGKKVHVYGGVCRFGATRLVFVTGTSGLKSKYKRQRTTSRGTRGSLQSGVCGAEYVNDVIPILYTDGLAMFKEQRVHSWVFVHDKASVHPGGSLYLKEKGQLVVEDWPSKGMDLNVMENVWAQVDRKVALAHDPDSTLEQYKQTLEEAWRTVCTPTYLAKCVESVPSRLEEVVKAQGGMSPH